jgi:hypothetical protein
MYGTKLKKFHGWVLHTTNEDGDGDEDDATALPEDRADGPDDGSSSGSDDRDGHEANEDGNRGEDDATALPEDCRDGPGSSTRSDEDFGYGARAVQLLAIRANFRIRAINAYDWRLGQCIYRAPEGEVQEVYNGHGMLYLPYISFMPLSFFIYCKKLKPFTFMLSCVGRNG